MNRSRSQAPLGIVRVLPTVEDCGVAPLSAQEQSRLLRGFDPTLILEAASTLLGEVENSEDSATFWEPTIWRLPLEDRKRLQAWVNRRPSEHAAIASSPLHALAVVATLKLALAQSKPGKLTNARREELIARMARVALRLNDQVVHADLDDRGLDEEEMEQELWCILAGMSLWSTVEANDWTILSGELVQALASVKDAARGLAAFRERNGLTLDEWFSRCLAERATRQLHGPRSWGGADGIDRALEEAWESVATITPDEAVRRAQAEVERNDGRIVVRDVFDLGWLAERPFVRAADGRRFAIWLTASNRYLVPSEVVRTLGRGADVSYDVVATWMGAAGHALLGDAIAATQNVVGEFRIPEDQIVTGGKKGDYVVGDGKNLLAIDFTLLSPTLRLAQGDGAGVEATVAKLACKFEQVYATLRWCDPAHAMNWLPLVVLLSPMSMTLEELVHRRLVADGIAPGGPAEVMICHATDFLDLTHYAADRKISLARAVARWQRNGTSFLDWWLHERGATRASSRDRSRAVVARCRETLMRAPETRAS